MIIIKDKTVVPSFAPIRDVTIVPDLTIRDVNKVIEIQYLLATEEGELVITEDGYCIDPDLQLNFNKADKTNGRGAGILPALF